MASSIVNVSINFDKVEKLLEKQLELLSELSQKSDVSNVIEITKAMCLLADYLSSDKFSSVL